MTDLKRAADELAAECIASLKSAIAFLRQDHAPTLARDAAVAKADAAIAALSAQPRPAETVDSVAWREALDLPDGYEVTEHLPGIWQYEYDYAAGRIASGASWNHPALAAIAAWQSVHQRPASAPVGVDGPVIGWLHEIEYADGWGGPRFVMGAEKPKAHLEQVRHPELIAPTIKGERLTPLTAALAQQPAAVDEAWLSKARELYDRCKLWPENSDDGFMALLDLRNHVAAALAQPQGEG